MILVSKSPKLFPQAPDIHQQCGPYQLQALLRAFDTHVPVEELYVSDLHRQKDWSLPWQLPGVLRRFGIRARSRFWTKPFFTKNLARAVETDTPAVFVVRSIQGTGCLHWISVWGHDPETNEFLVYDSQLPTAETSHGNGRYHADIITEALPWYGTFALTIRH